MLRFERSVRAIRKSAPRQSWNRCRSSARRLAARYDLDRHEFRLGTGRALFERAAGPRSSPGDASRFPGSSSTEALPRRRARSSPRRFRWRACRSESGQGSCTRSSNPTAIRSPTPTARCAATPSPGRNASRCASIPPTGGMRLPARGVLVAGVGRVEARLPPAPGGSRSALRQPLRGPSPRPPADTSRSRSTRLS